VGRKSKLTEETQKRILDFIRAGLPNKESANAVGMSERTFYDHLADNRSFRSAVEKAFAECAAEKVLRVRKAEPDSWQAAAWWLERRMRKDFGRVDRVEQTGEGGGPVQHEVSAKIDIKSLSNEQLYSLKELLAGAPRLGPASAGSRNGSREEEPA